MISSVTPSLVNSDSDSGLSEMGSDLFLELLVAQLQNQNPMEPMDGNALLQQTSQFQTERNKILQALDEQRTSNKAKEIVLRRKKNLAHSDVSKLIEKFDNDMLAVRERICKIQVREQC